MTNDIFQWLSYPVVVEKSVSRNAFQTIHFTIKNITKTSYYFKVGLQLQYQDSVSVLTSNKWIEVGDVQWTGDEEELDSIDPGVAYENGRVYRFDPEANYSSVHSYSIKVIIQASTNEDFETFYSQWKNSNTFQIAALSSGSRLNFFKLGSLYCEIDHSNFIVNGSVLATVDRSSLVATFDISPNATAKIGSIEQVSGVTENDYTSEVIFDVWAEDGTHSSYSIRIGQEAGGSWLIYEGINSKTEFDTYYLLDGYCRIRYFIDVKPNFDYIYYPSTVASFPLLLVNGEEDIGVGGLYITQNIQANVITTIQGYWDVPPGLRFEDNQLMKLKVKNGDNIVLLPFRLRRLVSEIVCLSFNEKLSVFQGERDIGTPYLISVGQDLYGFRFEDYLTRNKFYLYDYSDSTTSSLMLFEHEIGWEIEFDINLGGLSVIFQSLGIDMGSLPVIEKDVPKPLKITYTTYQHFVEQEPFYDDGVYENTGIRHEWENPWQPVRRNGRWYLSIRNAYVEDALIKNQKLKGTWLKIGMFGKETRHIYIRSVLTKFAKLFT